MVRVKKHRRVEAPNLLFHPDLSLDHERTPGIVPRALDTDVVAREGPPIRGIRLALTTCRINVPPQSAHAAAGAPHHR